MFEASLEDQLGVLVAAEANLRTRRDADVGLLRLALAWADLHPDESLPAPVDDIRARRRRLADLVGVRMGGEGTPLVLAHCPAELGAVLETTYTGARHLIADALDLRDRLPRLWMTVQDGGVVAWKARRVAAATRALTSAQVAEVDTAVYDVIATLGWSRFEAILDATVKQADPEGARAAEQLAATQRFVAIGRANDHHIRTLIARGTSLDILSFMAAVNRIAELLGDEGDPDPIDIRRSKATGILARPAHALELLARHQTRRTSEAAQDGEPDPEGDGHLSSPPQSPLRDDGHRCGCAPRIRLHVHLTDVALRGTDPRAVCRVDGVGPVTAQMVRDWLGRSDIAVTVQPVVLPDPPPVDGYEIPQAIRRPGRPPPRQRLPVVAECWIGRRPGPHHRLRTPGEGRPARSDWCRHAGSAGPKGAPAQDVRPHQSPAASPGRLLLAQPPRLGLAGHQHRHPPSRPRPRSRRLLASRRTEGRTATPTGHGWSSDRRAAALPDRPGPRQRQGRAHPAHLSSADTVRACAGPGRCGTGTSARLAALHARGLIEVVETFMHESVIGTRFASSVVETTTVGDYPAVVPSVAGQIDDLRPVHTAAE